MAEPSNQALGGLPAADPEVARQPQPTYKAFADGPPAVRDELVGVMVSSWQSVSQTLRKPEIFSSGLAMDLQTERKVIPLMIDPPDHRKYRKILDPLFTPHRVRPMEEPVTELANGLIDGFIDRPEIDFAREFSVPFPSQVFLTLFGLPLEQLPQFLAWKDGAIRPHVVLKKPIGDPEVTAYQQSTADDIYGYFAALLDERADVRRDDLLSHFLDAEVEGDRLSRNEILDICFTFLIAGLDTVSASLECFFAYLARHPDHRRQITDHPEVIPSAVEELLRWETPVMGVLRMAREDTEIDGCPVKAGDFVHPMVGAANLDEAEFPDAATVKLDREPNRHLSFGGGHHRCLGSHLARLELRVALREWHRRIPDYDVAPGVELQYSPGIRSVETFPMVLDRPQGR
ncbi:MAG TPA: cytochrome P450 [Acidimicrobiales bacterium]|nr:cytochrome P450 [Acidimicrobiales bacterium]